MRAAEKIADVERQLERGEAVVVFAARTTTTTITPGRGTAREIRAPYSPRVVPAAGHGPRRWSSRVVDRVASAGMQSRCQSLRCVENPALIPLPRS